VSTDLASTAAASVPASSAWTVAPSAAPLSFRKDADEGFPLGGAVMLVVLMVAAVWAWWYGRTRGGLGGRLPMLPASWGRSTEQGGELRIVEALQAAGGVRLMVVEWAGGRRVLVATSGTAAPVALDILPASAAQAGAAP
jgi:hypothetical protein